MSIVRFDPWHEPGRVDSTHWVPAVDIWEAPDAFRIEMELPGVSGEDVDICVEDGVLTVSGERKRERGAEDRGQRYERRYGPFSRRFRLPDSVDPEQIVARVRDGVLAVSIAKRAELKPRRIEVVAA